MSPVKVTTQAELDAAIEAKAETVYIESPDGVWLYLNSDNEGSSHVEARGSSHVEAWDSSHVEARDSSHVEAWGPVVVRWDGDCYRWTYPDHEHRFKAWMSSGIWLACDCGERQRVAEEAS